MSGVMGSQRPSLCVLEGSIAVGVRPEKIALSFVHPSARLDVPARAIRWIEAREGFTYPVKGMLFESPNSHIDVCLRADFAMRLYKLTQKIVGDFLEIRVESECVARPKVLQPIGRRGRFAIGKFDFDKAQAVAAMMRARCGITGPRLVQ
ncbi:MAG TPA: hypothetical protein VMA30_14690 [Xanthobacteraceae bacterium]|nr:hypothetical protein [Xanthobacteraceae bacterium]